MRAPVGGWVARAAAGAVVAAAALPGGLSAQADTIPAGPAEGDALYDRPFITSVGSTAVGGYLEGNTNWFTEDGISEGFSMELRRFNVFLYSSLSSRVRFLSELEFEHGTEEIALETALLDVHLRPSLILRAGIVLPPLGYFNQNHDSPRWDFVERPLVSTEIIPSTLSEVGFGGYGRVPVGGLLLSWDAYVTNGLADGIVGGSAARTSIPDGRSEELFGEDNNGEPALSARLGVRRPGRGEVALSWYGGAYNTFRAEGEDVDDRRRVDIVALDGGASLGPLDLRAEAAWARVEVPAGLAELFGDRQWGAHLDALVPVWRPRLPGYPSAELRAGVRLDYVDYNVGEFGSTGRPIRDDVLALVPTLAFRPTPGSVLRINYRATWTRDFPGNAAVRGAGLQVGVAAYF